MKRRKVEAWASVWPDGVVKIHGHAINAKDCAAPHIKTVRLVEHDPARDAVVRAAVRLVKERFESSGDELVAAVEQLQCKGRKK